MSARPRTFVGRVAWSLTAAAFVSSVLASSLTAALSTRWALAREDTRLVGAAATLHQELSARASESASRVADDEDQEVAPAGLRIALFERGARLGGDAALALTPEGCATVTREGRPWRRCAVFYGERGVVVAAPLDAHLAARRGLALAAFVSVLAATAAALAVGRRVGARIASPLARLREAMARVDPDAPARGGPQTPDEHEEIESLRRTLVTLLARLDGALSQSRRFAADAAHELRTPLTAALTTLELARGDDTTTRDALVRAEHALADMATLVERLLVLATPADASTVAREAVDLGDVVTEALSSLGDASRGRLRVSLAEDAVVRGDATLLRLLVRNVVDNALKFAPTGDVAVSVSREPDALVLRVRDEGAGIAAEDRARVFEAFYRGASSRRSSSGHGVGLALVAHVARLHGATARFEEVARGASLCVTFSPWRAG